MIQKKILESVIILLVFFLFLQSCISNKDIVYFQDNSFVEDSLTYLHNQHEEYRIQPGDILSVKIKSLEAENAEFLNIEPGNGFININPAALYINGYSVSDSGEIVLPLIGPIFVWSFTLPEAREKIQREVDAFFSDATVIVNLGSFKISVLGEVNSPGTFFIFNNRLTILEAIARAGDLKEFADRKELTLVRRSGDSSYGVLIDLTNPNVFISPYFFLKPNDILYVKPLKKSAKRSNLETLTIVSTILSIISTGVTVYLIFDN